MHLNQQFDSAHVKRVVKYLLLSANSKLLYMLFECYRTQYTMISKILLAPALEETVLKIIRVIKHHRGSVYFPFTESGMTLCTFLCHDMKNIQFKFPI